MLLVPRRSCRNGKSENAGAANIPYTVPTDDEAFVEIPIGFLTNGWVHVLTTSEIAALLMWFDVMKFDPSLHKLEDGSTIEQAYARSDVRHGFYGLGRDTYETHQPLDAFDLLDVVRHAKRHNDGTWQNFKDDSSDMAAHRVVLRTGARSSAPAAGSRSSAVVLLRSAASSAASSVHASWAAWSALARTSSAWARAVGRPPPGGAPLVLGGGPEDGRLAREAGILRAAEESAARRSACSSPRAWAAAPARPRGPAAPAGGLLLAAAPRLPLFLGSTQFSHSVRLRLVMR